MPETPEQQMSTTCRYAYEEWVKQARKTGIGTMPDAYREAWEAGRKQLAEEIRDRIYEQVVVGMRPS